MANIDKIIPFTYKWEGGLSRSTADTASKNPSPYVINGLSGWHTNKGITYPVFKAGASKYGYEDTLENFKDMPSTIWLKIAKGGYWDKLDLDNVKSQSVANVMFSWIWGSGYAWQPRMERYLKSKGIDWTRNNFKQLAVNLNTLTDKYGEKKIFDELIEQKKEFLLSLNQPANEKGWLNRLADLQTYSYSLMNDAIEVVKKNPKKIIFVSLFLGMTVTGLIMLYNKNK